MNYEEIVVPKKIILDVLLHLEAIIPSLDRIGSCYVNLTRNEYDRIVSDFMIDWEVANRLSYIRKELSALISYDELEQSFSDTPVWDLKKKRPPKSFRLKQRAR